MNTPRTDAVMHDKLRDGNDLPNLARQLETELAASQAKEWQLREALEWIVSAQYASEFPATCDFQEDARYVYPKRFAAIHDKARAALSLPPPPNPPEVQRLVDVVKTFLEWKVPDFSRDLFRDAKTEVWKQEMEAAKEALKPFTKE